MIATGYRRRLLELPPATRRRVADVELDDLGAAPGSRLTTLRRLVNTADRLASNATDTSDAFLKVLSAVPDFRASVDLWAEDHPGLAATESGGESLALVARDALASKGLAAVVSEANDVAQDLARGPTGIIATDDPSAQQLASQGDELVAAVRAWTGTTSPVATPKTRENKGSGAPTKKLDASQIDKANAAFDKVLQTIKAAQTELEEKLTSDDPNWRAPTPPKKDPGLLAEIVDFPATIIDAFKVPDNAIAAWHTVAKDADRYVGMLVSTRATALDSEANAKKWLDTAKAVLSELQQANGDAKKSGIKAFLRDELLGDVEQAIGELARILAELFKEIVKGAATGLGGVVTGIVLVVLVAVGVSKARSR